MVVQQLTDFYNTATADQRLGASHVSLYMALFQFWNINGFQNPIAVSRSEIMPVAKMSGRATYHRCMKELEEYGYIKYIPSFNPFLKSLVYFQPLTD